MVHYGTPMPPKLKGYLCYKTIFCYNVALDAQLMNFFIWSKIMLCSWDTKFSELPLCQECHELSGISEILPKSKENVKKIDEFFVMSGICQEFSTMC